MGELLFVGLGLGGVQDMSVRALAELKSCDAVFAEFYTSKLADAELGELEDFIGKRIRLLDRVDVEEGEELFKEAKRGKVAFLSAGDTMAATTHVDLRLQALDLGIPTKLIHGISIFTACATSLGLQPYKFGRTITLPFPEKGFHPISPYEHMLENKKLGLHSLVLMDIKVDQKRYMSANEGIQWLLDAEDRVGGGLLDAKTVVCAACRVGSSTELLASGYPQTLLAKDLGPPLHTLVVPGKLHFMEAEALVKLAGAPEEILEE